MTSSRPTPRSLTQMLRELDDAALSDLLRTRPDLGRPRPASFSQVASRATTRESVRAALDRLNAVELWVADQASRTVGPVSAADIEGVDAATAAAALARLRGLALLWGDPLALRPVRALTSELQRLPVTVPPEPAPPDFDNVAREDPDKVAKVAAGSAFELVRRIEVLIEYTDHTPLHLKQDGGLAQREARAVGSLLDLPVTIAVIHAQVAQAAGLLGIVPEGRAEILLPTVGFDRWQDLSLSGQWAWLVRGWLEGHPPSGSARLKALCLSAFGDPEEGRVIGVEEIGGWLAWHLPRRVDDATRRAVIMLTQAGWLGVTALGALARFGMGDDVSGLDRLLPDRADTVLVQNDLTAIAPGPLTAQAARELGALADVESRGGATVYRFTVASLQRARAHGWSPAEMSGVLTARSRTPLPQPLTYLIADLGRSESLSASTPRTTRGPRPTHQPPVRAAVTPLAGAHAEPIVDSERAARIVRKLRRETRRSQTESLDPYEPASGDGRADSPIETLREAVESGELVWVGYVDTQGASGERLVYASAVEEGRVVARDSRTGERLGIPVHRITVAHIIRGGSV